MPPQNDGNSGNDVFWWQELVAVAREGRLLLNFKDGCPPEMKGCTPAETIDFIREVARGAGGDGSLAKLEEMRGLVSDKFLADCYGKTEPFHCPYGPERRCSVERPACQCQADLWDTYLGAEGRG